MRLHERPLAITAALLAVGLGTAACGSSTQEEVQYKTPTDSRTPDQALPKPKGDRVRETIDRRTGAVYACMYLNDMGVPANTPIPLRKISTDTYSDSNFQVQGSTHGYVLGGWGQISGYTDGSGSVAPEQVDVVRFVTPDSVLKTLMIKDSAVETEVCADECEPSLTVNVSDEPLWYKGANDATSIWEFTHEYGLSCYFDENGREGQRLKWAAKVAVRTEDATCNSAANGVMHVRQYAGGPLPDGAVISELADSVTLSVPNSYASQ